MGLEGGFHGVLKPRGCSEDVSGCSAMPLYVDTNLPAAVVF
jgi:hypothetical protein